MLVLKQRRGEVIVIGEALIHVLRISDEWVELGITAPPAWAITREINIQDGTEDACTTIRSSGNDGLSRPTEQHAPPRRDITPGQRT
jgi:sRNA-binding carbon storage regulator CsrA